MGIDNCSDGGHLYHSCKTVIYTCVVGDYDKVAPVQNDDDSLVYIYFTDRLESVPDGWLGRALQSPKRLTSNHDINRYHKIFPHRLLRDFRFSIYIDGNINYLGKYQQLIEKMYAANSSLAVFSHPQSRNLREEFQACIDFKKFDGHDLGVYRKQLTDYQETGFDLSSEVTANYLIVRDHADLKLSTTMSLWWSQLFEYAKRDQLSLTYVLYITELPWIYLDKEGGVDPELINRCSHHKGYLRPILSGIIGNIQRRLSSWNL